jgi:hypothetical protein
MQNPKGFFFSIRDFSLKDFLKKGGRTFLSAIDWRVGKPALLCKKLFL